MEIWITFRCNKARRFSLAFIARTSGLSSFVTGARITSLTHRLTYGTCGREFTPGSTSFSGTSLRASAELRCHHVRRACFHGCGLQRTFGTERMPFVENEKWVVACQCASWWKLWRELPKAQAARN